MNATIAGRSAVAAVLFAAACLSTGCKKTRPNELTVYPVKGRVTHNGEPMSHAILTFYPADKEFSSALKSRASADAEGNFVLTTYELNDGAPAGEYKLVLYWPVDPPGPFDLEQPNPPDRLKHQYSDPVKTKLKTTYVVKAEPTTLDVKLP
ncbi:MAG TPA: hypothetical protein VGE52_18645 [Pirellulales bacterium]